MLEKCTLCFSATVATIEQTMQHHIAEGTLFSVSAISFISTFDLYSFCTLEKCFIMTGFYAVTVWLYVNAVLCLYVC